MATNNSMIAIVKYCSFHFTTEHHRLNIGDIRHTVIYATKPKMFSGLAYTLHRNDTNALIKQNALVSHSIWLEHFSFKSIMPFCYRHTGYK